MFLGPNRLYSSGGQLSVCISEVWDFSSFRESTEKGRSK